MNSNDQNYLTNQDKSKLEKTAYEIYFELNKSDTTQITSMIKKIGISDMIHLKEFSDELNKYLTDKDELLNTSSEKIKRKIDSINIHKYKFIQYEYLLTKVESHIKENKSLSNEILITINEKQIENEQNYLVSEKIYLDMKNIYDKLISIEDKLPPENCNLTITGTINERISNHLASLRSSSKSKNKNII